MAAFGALALAALGLLARSLEPPATPPLPPDVGLGLTRSSPVVVPTAGEDAVGAGRLEARGEVRRDTNRAKDRASSPRKHADAKPKAKSAPPAPAASPPPAAPSPPPPAPSPAAPVPAPPSTTPPPTPPDPPSPQPTQPEFGFEQ